MKALKLFVAVLVASCSLPLIGQNRQAFVAAACGDLHQSMVVGLASKHPVIEPPEPGKARIYFIQDGGGGLSWTNGYPTTKIGIDGRWVGANNKSSFFFVSVTPGEHHLCAAVQSKVIGAGIELAHLTAESGKVYYCRTRLVISNIGTAYQSIVPVDSDQGQYLVAFYPLATAHARK